MANELARFNVKFRIVEKTSHKPTWAKSLLITSRTMNILENIGLVDEILSKGTIMEGVDIHFNQMPSGSVDMSIDDPTIRYPFPFVISQPDVEAAFERVLDKRGFHVERTSEVIDVVPTKDYVDVSLNNGENVRAYFVVGCDGAHSFVRRSQPDWDFEGRPVNLLWAQCDGTVTDPQINPTRSGFFVGPNGSTSSRFSPTSRGLASNSNMSP